MRTVSRAGWPSSAAPDAAAEPPREPAPPAPGAARASIPAREVVAAFLAYAAITVWWLWPLVLDPWRRLVEPAFASGVPDLRLLVWALAWDAHALVTRPSSLFHANAFHPAPLSLAYSEHLLGYAPIFAPVYWLTQNPIFSTNVLILLLFPLRALAMFLFARLYVAAPAAALAGALYGFAPGAKSDLAMFHVHGFFYLPLALFWTVRWLERARVRDAVLLAIALFLQATTSAYLGFALAFAYGTALPFLVAGAWRELDRRRVVGLAAAIGAALAGAALLALPYLWLKELGLVPEYDEAGSEPLGLVMAAGRLQAYLVYGGVGAIGYALGALALLPSWKGRARVLLLGVALVAVGMVVSAGPDPSFRDVVLPSPYRLLMRWLPGFATVRLPSRLTVVCHLGFALLAALGAARLLARLPRPAAWGASLVALCAALLLQPAIPLRTAEVPLGDDVPEVYRVLARDGAGRPVLELPKPDWDRASLRMLFSTVHWLPIVDGYSGYTPPTDDYLHEIARGLPARFALERLVDRVDLGWIVVHLDEMDRWEAALWLGRPPKGLRPVGRYGSDLLFRVDARPVDDRRALLLSTEQTLEGRPREWLAGPCPGEVLLVGGPKAPWGRGRILRLKVLVRNESRQTWPADGVIPAKLVRLRTCFERDAVRICPPGLRMLPADVPPGGSVRATLLVATPRVAGDYRFTIEPVQVGGASLESCGVRPLDMPVRID